LHPDEAVLTITGRLAVTCAPSLRVSRTCSGLFSALKRCGSNDAVRHAVQALENIQATSRAMAGTRSSRFLKKNI
jgi:hypothetical protein